MNELLTRGEAEEMANYLRTIALHEGTVRKCKLSVTIYQDKDEDNIPYEEVRIWIPFTQREPKEG